MNSNEHPRVLILSDATWADENNIGNTFSNLFEGWPKDKIAMIYARPDLPNTVVCDNFFQISENRLIKRFLNFNIKTGKKINNSELNNLEAKQTFRNEENSGKKIYSFFLKYRWNVFLIAREFLWKIGNWKTKELDDFIEEFSPEIVLSLACPGIYMNRLQQYIIVRSKAKPILYFVDDVYSLKQFSLAPLFWLNKLMQRRSINKTIELSSSVYTIVPKQKYEYDNSFNKNTKLLTKGGNFETNPNREIDMAKPFKLVYTGNIYAGRWDTLESIGRALDEINQPGLKGVLYVYTKNELTTRMKKSLSEIKSIRFMGGIPASKISEVQRDSDILIHVESLRLKEKLMTRLSFSTKLVDYFAQRKCILAVGWSEAASIEYLRKNDIAVVVDDVNKINIRLKELLDQPETIQRYGLKSWTFGKENHDIHTIKELLRQDMVDLMHPNDCNR